jgi:serine/threonine-protein kinase
VPDQVAGSVTKALALLPADRHASMAEFSRTLALARGDETGPAAIRRRPTAAMLGLGVAVAIVVALAWSLLRPAGAPDAERDGLSRLAVLPFENLGDSADSYFADGVTDAVRGKLTGLPGLRVTASNSSNEYRASRKSPRQIGDELGVEYLLVGRVRWARNADGTSRVQLSPELIDVSTGAAIWQEPFDASLTDIFATQGDIATRVADQLGLALGAQETEQLHARPTADLAAYDAYLRGEAESQGLNSQEPVRLRRAAARYREAVTLDSSFGLAWAQLSRTLAQLYFLSAPRPDDAAASKDAAERAYRLAPRLAEALIARGDHDAYVVHNAASARAAYRAALEVAPDHATILTNLARSERFLGDWEAALRHAERAAALDPRSSRTAWLLGYSYLTRGRLEEAMTALDRGLIIAPASLDLIETKAMVHLAMGNRAAAERIARTPPAGVGAETYAAYFAIYWDLYWLLDEGQQATVLALPVEAFDGNEANRSVVRAQILAYQGNDAGARAAADSSQAGFARQMEGTPDDAQLHALRGIALAYLGNYPEAVRMAERAIELEPNAEFLPYFRHQLLRVHLLGGEHDRAIAELERLSGMEYFLTPGWLRVDPTFDALRSDERFKALVDPPT